MAVPPISWLYVVSGIVFSSLAQICMKRATTWDTHDVYWFAYIGGSAFSYLISFACYYMALKVFSISRISPVMTVGVVLIVVAYGFSTGETVTFRQSIGVLLGIISIMLILS